jgi:hypothetical protein
MGPASAGALVGGRRVGLPRSKYKGGRQGFEGGRGRLEGAKLLFQCWIEVKLKSYNLGERKFDSGHLHNTSLKL